MAGTRALDYEALDEGQFAAAKAAYSLRHNENGHHGIAPWCEGQPGWGQFSQRIATPGTVAHAAFNGLPIPDWEPAANRPYSGPVASTPLDLLEPEERERLVAEAAARRAERRRNR